MGSLSFGVLGPLEVWRNDRPVVVPRGRRRSVLAALLVDAARPVSADVLIEAAWHDDVPADARSALHTVVSRLRDLLGRSAIVAGPAGYRLDVPAGSVDAHRFEALCVAAGEARPEDAAVLLDEALGMWRGPAYAEFADRAFVEVAAQRLDLLRADAREERARLALDLDQPDDAVRRLDGLLAENPFREHAVGLLMSALWQAGRSTDALARYRDHRRRMIDELGLDPAPALQGLEARILSGGGLGDMVGEEVIEVPDWLDASTAFLGRADDLEALVAAVARSKVVTVTGLGGVGKTRLVAEALPALVRRLQKPVTVVELAAVEPSGVEAAIVDALGLRGGASARTQLIGHLRATGRLLVLDNCEHVVDSVAPLIELLVRRCSALQVVLTSRRRLDLVSEQVLRLSPLSPPSADEPLDRLQSSAAVMLLADRIRRVRPSFGLTPANLLAVADICRRLDGLPLALELAASRIAILGVEEVRDRLKVDPGPLDGDLLGAHRLRALVDWSCGLLTADERELFASLSVFPSDFDMAAATGVGLGLRPSLAGSVVAILAELVDSSLVTSQEGPGGVRYRLLAVVREQAARRLAESGREDDARRAHAGWVAQLTTQASQDCTGPRGAAAFARLQHSRADIESALRWSLAVNELDLAARIAASVQLCPHWIGSPKLQDLIIDVGEQCLRQDRTQMTLGIAAAAIGLAVRGDVKRALELAHSAVGNASTTTEHYLALAGQGIGALYAGDPETSRHSWEAILELRSLPLALKAEAHISLALLAHFTGDRQLAHEQSRLAVTLAKTSESAPVRAFALYAAGEASAGEPDGGARLLIEAAEVAASINSAQIGHLAEIALFAALVRTGHHDQATKLAPRLLRDVRRAGTRPQLCTTLRILAELQALTSRPHEAAMLLAAGSPRWAQPMGEDVPRYAQLRSVLRTRLGDQTWDRINAAAQEMSPEQVADSAAASSIGQQTAG